MRKDCSVNCVNLAAAVRQLGGHPTDVPSTRFSLQLKGETLAEILDLAQSAQHYVVAELSRLLDEPNLAPVRSALALVIQLHRDNQRWLQATRGRPE